MTRSYRVREITCPECDRVCLHHARGLCHRCWQRLKWHGRLEEYPRSRQSPEYWAALADTSDPGSCWIWPGPRNPRSGYGWTGSQTAHVWAYERALGPVPEGRELDHTCHTRSTDCPGGAACPHRPCFNPGHLEAVDHTRNLRRGGNRDIVCSRGHRRSVAPDGTKRGECRECRNERRRAAYWADPGAARRAYRERYARTKSR